MFCPMTLLAACLASSQVAAAEGWSGTTTEEDTPPEQVSEDQEEEREAEEDSGQGEPLLSPEQMAEAAGVPEVSGAQIEWLRPRLRKLPPNPRAQVDYTAYTLDFGEVRIGLSNTQVGILPRTQVGTNLPLNLLGIQNANIKVNPLRLGRFDLALQGSGYRYTQEDFAAQYWAMGPTLSAVLSERWGMHLGAQYWSVAMDGTFSAAEVYSALGMVDDLGFFPDIAYQGQAASARLAVDYRLNRRDSFVLDVSSVLWMEDLTGGGAKVPAMLAPYAATSEQWSPLNSYRATLAYQMDLKRLSLKAGVGVSSPSYLWVLSSFEASYRFGGSTKADERRQRSAWRQDRRSQRSGGSDSL
ncbi:MAG: hypothetical protein ACI9VR_004408 [Cognaticolwellia sp.]|jgi:hypothetical protein